MMLANSFTKWKQVSIGLWSRKHQICPGRARLQRERNLLTRVNPVVLVSMGLASQDSNHRQPGQKLHSCPKGTHQRTEWAEKPSPC
jgi:hypothetical protein